MGFVECGGVSAVVGYDIQDEVDSKLGAMNAIEAVNENERTNLGLTGTIKRFEVMLQKLDYIHNNPVEAGIVSEPEYYQYSSALDYSGGKGFVPILYID